MMRRRDAGATVDEQRVGDSFTAADIEPIDADAWPPRPHRGAALEGLDDADWRRLRHDASTYADDGRIDWSLSPRPGTEGARSVVDAFAAPGSTTADAATASRPARRILVAAAGGAAAVLAVGLLARGGDSERAAPAGARPVGATDVTSVPGPAPTAMAPATTVPATTVPTTTVPTTTAAPVTTAAPATTVPATTLAPATTVPATAVPATTAPPTRARPAALASGIALEDLGDHPWWGELAGGQVYLRGRIASRADADAAVATATANSGDATVVDELVVDPTATPGTGSVPLFLVEVVPFERDSATVGDEYARLVGFARFTLFVQPGARLVVVGGSDGEEAASVAAARAAGVAAGVAGAVIDAGRITTIARPAPPGSPPRAEDRRVAFVFLGSLDA